MSNVPCLTPAQLNSVLFEQAPRINDKIAAFAKDNPIWWNQKIPKGTFEYGNGYVQRNVIFHADIAPQVQRDALWRPIGASAAGQGEEEDYVSCNPPTDHVVSYGFEEKSYSPFELVLKSEPVCLADLVYKWQFSQQLSMITDSWRKISEGVWENWNRDTYIGYATIFPAVPGFLSAAGAPGVIPNPVNANLGRMSQGYLDILYSHLARGARQYSIGMKGAAPQFAIITSPETSAEIIQTDPNAVTGGLAAIMSAGNSQATNAYMQGYGASIDYKNFSHIHDPFLPRFVEDANEAAGFRRVYPWASSATTVRNKWEINMEYLTAPYELTLVWVKDVFTNMVLPSMPSNLAGMKFDPHSFVGQFEWKNFPEKDCNEWGEIGYFAARYRNAPKPGPHDLVFGILHSRCVPKVFVGCSADVTTTITAGTTGEVLNCQDYGDEDSLRVIVELDKPLTITVGGETRPVAPGDTVTVTYADTDPGPASTASATVVAGANAPSYILELPALVAPATSQCGLHSGIASVKTE